MINPKDLSITDFNYELPEERIAKYPLQNRDASKLLIYRKGEIKEDIYGNIADHIPAGSLLIFNDTKVVEARILFQKPTGGMVEIFCLEPHDNYPDITTALSQHEDLSWYCLIGGASKWKHGQVLEKKIHHGNKEFILRAKWLDKKMDSFLIGFSWTDPALSFAEVLHYAGAIPLPPYLKRDAEISDAERYQTIYAQFDGSVAAPTAGLHFTESIFEKLKIKNIQKDFITLHVGAGTFKPVKTEFMSAHEMHAEFISVSRTTIENILQNLGENIITVGTTSLRTIESLYWLGVKASIVNRESSMDNLISSGVTQWEPYELKNDIDPETALQALLDQMDKKKIERLITKTQIMIAPPYQPKIAKALITNFHQPRSTLLLLVAALIGKDWRKLYDHALANDFRFLSYGDGCLIRWG